MKPKILLVDDEPDALRVIGFKLNRPPVGTHMRRLREKIGVAADYLETVRGVGYRFQP